MKARTLPPIPRAVFSMHGDIVVTVVEGLKDPQTGEPLFGYWDAFQRSISLRSGMHPVTTWLTLFHESTHADLADIGVSLSDDQEEAVCEAIARVRYAAMLAGLK